jgi:acyl-coenzyme A thioesterase PaaI-like protein
MRWGHAPSPLRGWGDPHRLAGERRHEPRRKSHKFMTALFSTAMALREVDPGVYTGELNKHWTIGPKVHGGAMLALCANAARTAHGGAGQSNWQPVAVSGSFLWAPDPGPMRLVTSIRKRVRRISVVDVELIQGDRAAVHAVVTLGEPEHLAPPLLSANPAVGLMDPEPPDDVAPIGPGHPLAGLVHLAEGCDVRPLISTLGPPTAAHL